MPPFFSIIIPTFNSATQISGCLSSIENQEFKNFEVIVVDGRSADRTCELVETFITRDARFRLFSEKDSGVYDAMNKGIGHSSGEWLFFLGSDDRIFDEQVLKDISDLSAGRQSQVIYGNVKITGKTGWAKDGLIYDGEFNLKKLLHKNICHQAIFYRAEFINKHIFSFNTKYKVCSDWDFNMRCWQKTKFIFLDRVITDYSGGGLSATVENDIQFENDFKENIESYFGKKALRLKYAEQGNRLLTRAAMAFKRLLKHG